MNPAKSQDPSPRRSGEDTSLERALLRNIVQRNTNGSLPIVSRFLSQRAQPISSEKIQSILQAALDLTEDFALDFELDEEFEALERSVVD
jgi:hypothetical protein